MAEGWRPETRDPWRRDGERILHDFADASTGHIVELVELVRVGDDPEPPTGDTHPGNLRTMLAKVENVENKLDQVLDRLPAPDPAPGLSARPGPE